VPIQTSIDVISSDLLQVEAILHSVAGDATPPLSSMTQSLFDAGGKRIRPAITLLMGRMLQAPAEPLFQLAAALEITHTATLIHDDLVDHADTRRGQSALHVRYSTALAMLAGDYLFAQAARLVARTGCTPLVETFASMLATMVRGEVDQYVDRSTFPTMDAYLQRIFAKTGAMFEAGCASAALLAGASAVAVDIAGRYGREVGTAFQMMDDVLDFSGSEESMGKPALRDLLSGTVTLPVLAYRQTHPDDSDLQALQSIQRDDGLRPAFDPTTAHRLAHSIQTSDALTASVSKAEEHAQLARQCLQTFDDSPYRTALDQFATEAAHRVS
jgi:all-trans-nonaprenyl-diphosphate synthase